MSDVRWFRGRPVVVTAIRWTGDNTEHVKSFAGMRPRIDDAPRFLIASEVSGVIRGDGILYDDVERMWVPIRVGDWVVRRGVENFTPFVCTDEAMREAYEEINTDNVDACVGGTHASDTHFGDNVVVGEIGEVGEAHDGVPTITDTHDWVDPNE